ncbi:hypothetical protein B0H11DRAFT_2411363 [Mycena galericulata]|nr:hypothetical protein B0H11DRAFT_2411363 [Mycena galericulata]
MLARHARGRGQRRPGRRGDRDGGADTQRTEARRLEDGAESGVGAILQRCMHLKVASAGVGTGRRRVAQGAICKGGGRSAYGIQAEGCRQIIHWADNGLSRTIEELASLAQFFTFPTDFLSSRINTLSYTYLPIFATFSFDLTLSSEFNTRDYKLGHPLLTSTCQRGRRGTRQVVYLEILNKRHSTLVLDQSTFRQLAIIDSVCGLVVRLLHDAAGSWFQKWDKGQPEMGGRLRERKGVGGRRTKCSWAGEIRRRDGRQLDAVVIGRLEQEGDEDHVDVAREVGVCLKEKTRRAVQSWRRDGRRMASPKRSNGTPSFVSGRGARPAALPLKQANGGMDEAGVDSEFAPACAPHLADKAGENSGFDLRRRRHAVRGRVNPCRAVRRGGGRAVGRRRRVARRAMWRRASSLSAPNASASESANASTSARRKRERRGKGAEPGQIAHRLESRVVGAPHLRVEGHAPTSAIAIFREVKVVRGGRDGGALVQREQQLRRALRLACVLPLAFALSAACAALSAVDAPPRKRPCRTRWWSASWRRWRWSVRRRKTRCSTERDLEQSRWMGSEGSVGAWRRGRGRSAWAGQAESSAGYIVVGVAEELDVAWRTQCKPCPEPAVKGREHPHGARLILGRQNGPLLLRIVDGRPPSSRACSSTTISRTSPSASPWRRLGYRQHRGARLVGAVDIGGGHRERNIRWQTVRIEAEVSDVEAVTLLPAQAASARLARSSPKGKKVSAWLRPRNQTVVIVVKIESGVHRGNTTLPLNYSYTPDSRLTFPNLRVRVDQILRSSGPSTITDERIQRFFFWLGASDFKLQASSFKADVNIPNFDFEVLFHAALFPIRSTYSISQISPSRARGEVLIQFSILESRLRFESMPGEARCCSYPEIFSTDVLNPSVLRMLNRERPRASPTSATVYLRAHRHGLKFVAAGVAFSQRWREEIQIEDQIEEVDRYMEVYGAGLAIRASAAALYGLSKRAHQVGAGAARTGIGTVGMHHKTPGGAGRGERAEDEGVASLELA